MSSQTDGELVEDVMATRVVKIESESTVREAASMMDRRRCSCLVVGRANMALGIVTERDLVRKVLALGVDPSKVLISDIMSVPLITIGPKARLIEAAEKMSEYLVRRLVVVDEMGVLVGLITAADIARLLAKKKKFSDSVLIVEGLRKLSKIEFSSKQDMIELAMYLQELKLYASLHRQIETEIARIADSDSDCQLLMSHPGISSFTAVAIKARVGDASRFPTKKHLCSYAGVVPKASNSGEYVSEHAHVKHGDDVLKYALTCAVRGAVRANADSTVKKFYNKQIGRGMDPKKAEVAAARKLACIVWKILTSKQRYEDEDKYLTMRKTKENTSRARRILRDPVEAQNVSELAESLSTYSDVLERYPDDLQEMS